MFGPFKLIFPEGIYNFGESSKIDYLCTLIQCYFCITANDILVTNK